MLSFAYDERSGRGVLVSTSFCGWRPSTPLVAGIRQYARFGNFFDIPQAQLALGRTLAQHGDDGLTRATGNEAQGLALMLLGRPAVALAHLDWATALLRSGEALLQQAEWRVLLTPLGLGTPATAQLDDARSRLVKLAAGAPAARAAWSLAVAAIENGDSTQAARWTGEVAAGTAADSNAVPLHRLLLALAAAHAGHADSAVALATPLLSYNPRGVGADPFARALLHLKLGDWLAGLGDARGAERVWLWAEAWDVIGWPEREVQAGEVDVAVSAVARLRRGRLALERGRSTVACKHLTRVRELWARAEPSLARARTVTDSLTRGCP